MDLIIITAYLIGALFFLGFVLEVWLWWYPGFVLRAKRARRHARYGR